ncbi:MAG: NAD(P)-dependent alcohol dehydrogenase [Phaeodactylibacter sp.]|nr:NAD(P)-dependent alcohol dehydrogenase [Phaeodactylibacter sp.]
MKAIINRKYGSPDQLELREVERPDHKANEVLVKVLAASINKADWHILNGKPFPVRLMAGLFKPRMNILGADIAGVVERVGGGVTQFRPGHEVFGDLSATGFGGFAEYVVTDEQRLSRKPSNLSYEATAALPMGAITALQGLRDKGKIQAGQQVLINGASGGVGGFALQIAKAFDAEVTAVCSSSKVDLARQQDADQVIDYTLQDFTKLDRQYDLIFDIIGNHPLSAIGRVLKPSGRYVSCAFSLGAALRGTSKSGKKFINLLASANQADLQFICKLAEEGKLQPQIQQTFTLDDVPEALALMGRGSLAGKLVVSI